MTDYTKPISRNNPPESRGRAAKAVQPVVAAPQAPLSKPSLEEPTVVTPPVVKKTTSKKKV